ncbi:hypothetical protein FMM05_02565 [Flavobacterium zepuense]|uniref:Prepilin-type N-terminal cleavage/methylation domain-containing protein n=1 Tax=Flavobacterium zepuense TaxID=2593302 RepID=A0A552VAN3_9FLAO|nr:prepilin-type N-terminal cleavage/methylation domain-containing protein [Flavobacterium zepuense]TRW27541.1 hypothetical protein FMM05_02565 [Flavobacterium zepuense]
MNNNGYNIKAFTIVEVVVGLAITAIIIAIIFVIFTVSSERLFDFKKQNQQINDVNRLTYSLQKGIYDSELMMLLDDDALIFNNYDGSKSRYNYTAEYFVLERENLTDTFFVAVTKVKIDTISSESKKNIYQRLQCHLNIDNVETQLNFYKKIYADQLLKVKDKNEF